MLTEILPFFWKLSPSSCLAGAATIHAVMTVPKNAIVMAQSYSALSLMTLLSRIPLSFLIFLWKKEGAIQVCAFCLKAQPKQQKGSHDVRRHMCEGFCGGILNSMKLPCFWNLQIDKFNQFLESSEHPQKGQPFFKGF